MRTTRFLLAAVAALAIAGPAWATITVQGTEQPQYIPITNQLALSHGVTFSSTMPFVTFGDNGNSVAGIYGTDPSFSPVWSYAAYYAPIELTFVDMGDGITPAVVTGTISAVYGDAGGDTDGIRLRAYDINNVLLGTQTALSVSWGNISISGTGIHRVLFDQSGLGAGTSDTFLDWVSYPEPVAVPEPASLFALAGAMLAFAVRRGRAADPARR